MPGDLAADRDHAGRAVASARVELTVPRSAPSSPLALLLPLVLLALDARSAGLERDPPGAVPGALAGPAAATRSISALVVLLAAGHRGAATAWCTERTAAAGPPLWTVLLVLPVAIPDFVVGYAWHSIAPTIDAAAAAPRW